MRVELGPVDAASARAFALYGHRVLTAAAEETLPADLRDVFAGYLAEWSGAAASDGVVRWSYEAPCDEVKYLLHAFYRMAVHVESRVVQRSLPVLPHDATPFYQCLVRSLLDAVAAESHTCATWAEELGSFWPGIDPVECSPRPVASGTW